MLSGSGMRTLGGKALNAAKGSLLLRLVVIGHDEVFFEECAGERCLLEKGSGERERKNEDTPLASLPHPQAPVHPTPYRQ